MRPHVDGVAHRPRHVVDVEARHQLRAVRLDGFDAHVEQVGHLLRRAALGYQLEHFALAWGELFEGAWLALGPADAAHLRRRGAGHQDGGAQRAGLVAARRSHVPDALPLHPRVGPQLPLLHGSKALWANAIWLGDKPWADFHIEDRVYNAVVDTSLESNGA
jgi:hypothetical protein